MTSLTSKKNNFLVEGLHSSASRRLVILVPNLMFDENDLASQLWELASPAGLKILFLGLCRDLSEEAIMRRRLAMLSALMTAPNISVEMRLEFGKRWDRRIIPLLESGDSLISLSKETADRLQRSLSKSRSEVWIKLWKLDDMVTLNKQSNNTLLREIAYWLVSVAIIFVFFLLQARMFLLSAGWAANITLSLTVLVEIGILYLWHSLIS